MKEKLKDFFSDTLNIVLTVFQVLGILAFLMIELSFVCSMIFFLCEGVFFIILGVKMLKKKKTILEQQAIYDQLPYSKEQLDSMHRANERAIKNNTLVSALLISLGIVLIFCIFYVLF